MVIKIFKIIFLFSIITSVAMAKNMSGLLTVSSLKKSSKDLYSIQFKEKAAIYSSSKKYIKCIISSTKQNKRILVRWDMKTLRINGCKAKQ